MKRSTRLFMILYTTIGMVALMGAIQRITVGAYQSAILSILIVAFCAYRVYDTMKKDPQGKN